MDDLEERLLKTECSSYTGDVTTCWHRNPDGTEAADRLRTYRKALEKIANEGYHLRDEDRAIARQALKG